MYRVITAAFALGALITVPATAGELGEAGDLEHARASARAGGPISERDAELLERYGCLSGTRKAFCQGLAHGRHYYLPSASASRP